MRIKDLLKDTSQPPGRQLGGRLFVQISFKNAGKQIRYMISLERYLAYLILGRELTSDETIHHKNGNPLDCRIENLMIIPQSDHNELHRLISCFLSGTVFPLEELNMLVGRETWKPNPKRITPNGIIKPGEYACLEPLMKG